MFKPNLQVKYLNNGITLISDYRKRLKISTVAVGVKVGAGYETEESKYGISHFVEHLLFKGTKNRPTAENLLEEAEQLGCTFNAYTADNQTVYHIEGQSKHLEKHLDILLDCVFNSTFPENEIEKEREVIKQEIMMNEDDPSFQLIRFHNKKVFEKSWAEHWVAGTCETVDNITREDLISFYKNWYVPERIVICSYGNCTIEQLEKYVNQFLRYNVEERNGFYLENTVSLYIPEFKKDIKEVEYKDGIQQTYAMWSFGLITPEERPYSTFLNEITVNGFSSILYKRIREELGLVYSFYSDSTIGLCGQRILNFCAICDTKNVPIIEVEIIKALNNLKNGKLTSKQIKRAKNNREYALLDTIERNDQSAVDIVFDWINTGRYKDATEFFSLYKNLKKENIVNFVCTCYDTEHFNRFEVRPREE